MRVDDPITMRPGTRKRDRNLDRSALPAHGAHTMPQDAEKRVRAFYEHTAPGHREALRGLQTSHVVYDMPEGMPIGAGHYEGLDDVLGRFLTSFYGALDVHFLAEEFVAARDTVAAIGRIQGKTRAAGVPVDVPFVHVWTVRDGHLQRMRAFTDTALLARLLGKS